MRTEKRMVYVMTCWVGFMNEETEEIEDDINLTEEYTANTQEELERLWDSFHEGEEAGIYGYYGGEPAYYTDYIISDEKEEREFYV